jgi:hypothetical protein
VGDHVRYYTVKKGRAFWAPGKFGSSYGLPKSQPLGPAGPAALACAALWNGRLDDARAASRSASEVVRTYPAGSLGHFYEAFRSKTAWRLMALRTRDDYERAWPEIEKRFATRLVTKITADDSERFHAEIHPVHNEGSPYSWNEAHRILKVWRALLGALVSYEIRTSAPIGRVSNPSPKGRSGLWTHDDVLNLCWVAVLMGHKGMAVGIRLAWGAMLAPVDVWTLPRSGWRTGASRAQVATQREKTSKRVLHAVGADTLEVVDAYLASMPVLLPDAKLIRRYNGAPYRSKDTFGDDFRAVRAIAFPGDERQFLDLRRSALTEARLGGATKDDIGLAAANSVDRSAKLEETYLLGASERVLEARHAGRLRMASGNG